jgi:hypothetical protein
MGQLLFQVTGTSSVWSEKANLPQRDRFAGRFAGFRGVLTKNTGAGICFILRGGLPAAASTFAKATVDKLLARHSFSDGGRTLR